MTTTGELVAICTLLEKPIPSVPITLMNHEPLLAHQIIVDVVERAATKGITITQVAIDQEFAAMMDLANGGALCDRVPTTVAFEAGLGRQLKFLRGTN